MIRRVQKLGSSARYKSSLHSGREHPHAALSQKLQNQLDCESPHQHPESDLDPFGAGPHHEPGADGPPDGDCEERGQDQAVVQVPERGVPQDPEQGGEDHDKTSGPCRLLRGYPVREDEEGDDEDPAPDPEKA